MRSWWIGAALLGGSALAHSQEYLTPPPVASPITDHFALRGEFFFGHVDTLGRIDSSTGVPGTPFSAERDLGLTDQAKQLRVEIIFRMVERSRLRVNFLDLRRQAQASIDRPIQFGDQTFQAKSIVQSEIDWRQMDLTYTYSFLRSERYELGAGVGIHLLEAEAIGQIPGTTQRGDFSGAEPFATLALDGTWLIAPRWALSARAQYLRVTIDSVSGMLGDYHADVQYRWQRNVAFGVGYEREQVDIDARNVNPSGDVNMTIGGPELFVRVSF